MNVYKYINRAPYGDILEGNMKKAVRILALVMIFTMVFGALGCEKKGKLVMGTNATFPPFEYLENGEIVGVDAEIMAAIAKEMGYELEITNMEFDVLPTALANGQIDVIAAGFTVNADREETMDFSTPYYTASQTIIVLSDSNIMSTADLMGKLVGVQSGTTGSFLALEYANVDDIMGFASGMLAVEALKNGQVDAVIIDNNPAKAYKDQNPDTLVLIEGLFDAEDYAFAVAKGDKELLTKINDALAAIIEDGTFDEIISKYIV
jgi:ABC-type amino acid transport substrate-binding protein